ncbi:hypothetical protein QA640_45770 (plasmid) [Bradyrhizobium sp. CB82]|uniref:hypothetical protein n=1 Tax=Bradyrhizobium sp. CB82 TaxID=3039159 RepID=UPI0024B0934D|nr:hypothetical protein [Bradyrhizobium sp. CB82]WFU46070.1 hypothetical protein QA640_45770 [Bradyrhizobium sp. CB82]
MLMAVFTTFAASRKQPLGDVVERVHAAFVAAGFGEPVIRFSISDPPNSPELGAITTFMGTKRVSSIERILKRWPELAQFASLAGSAARGHETRVMSNLTDSGAVAPIDFAILREIAHGVPRSFPCHRITLHFKAAGFSDGPELPPTADPRSIRMLARAGVDVFAGHPTSAGVSVTDSWWVNGRQRSLAALRLVEADPTAKKLPAPPANVQAVFLACGKVRKTIQVPFATAPAVTEAGNAAAEAAPHGALRSETGEAIRAVVRAHRERMTELLQQVPHDLPHHAESEAHSPTLSGIPATGPKKPELVKAFAPMGYDCRGEHGNFMPQRRTPGNLVVQLRVDIGGWGSTVNASIQVIGLSKGQENSPGFRATLNLPLSPQAARGMVRGVEFVGQFPIGGPDRWRQIVENLAHLVAALDRSSVPEVEAILGPSPEWFQPETAG